MSCLSGREKGKAIEKPVSLVHVHSYSGHGFKFRAWFPCLLEKIAGVLTSFLGITNPKKLPPSDPMRDEQNDDTNPSL